jgi:hypothetical protein
MAPDDFIPRDEATQLVERVAEGVRREFTAGLSTVQVQIGASEKMLSQKIKQREDQRCRVVGIGQTVAAIIAITLGQSPTAVLRSLLADRTAFS